MRKTYTIWGTIKKLRDFLLLRMNGHNLNTKFKLGKVFGSSRRSDESWFCGYDRAVWFQLVSTIYCWIHLSCFCLEMGRIHEEKKNLLNTRNARSTQHCCFIVIAKLYWTNLSFPPLWNLPLSVGPAAVIRPGRCAGAGGAGGQKCVLHALEVTGLWWGRQPAAGRPCRRHWMDRVWTPPPQDTEHWGRGRRGTAQRQKQNERQNKKQCGDINRRRRSNVEVHGERRVVIKEAEEGGERMEEKSIQRQSTDEENKHPIQHVLALQRSVRTYLLWWKHTGIQAPDQAE